VTLKPQKDFPKLKDFKAAFPVTKDTIFAYDGVIYTNNELPHHLIVHETTHLAQQEYYGVDHWTDEYLMNPAFRVRMEREAYMDQLKAIPKGKDKIRQAILCAKDLSSDLYGNLMTYAQAMRAFRPLLK